MLTLRREKTWDWDVKNKKTVQNPRYRESHRWLSEKFVSFDYSNDARFETFKNYPKNKQLYRKHKDYAKDYDRKVKFYKSCQRWHCVEWNRQISSTKERFSKLISGTFATSLARSKTLHYSYNKWAPRCDANKNRDGDHVTAVLENDPNDEDEDVNNEMSLHDHLESRSPRRLHSLRSISVDNINLATENERLVSHDHPRRDDVSGRASIQEMRPVRARYPHKY